VKPELCEHQQNPAACLTCWRAHPTPPLPVEVEPPPYTRIVHFGCGCRVAVSSIDGVVKWQPCETGHPAMPKSARWWFDEAIKQLGHYEHRLQDRAKCEDERCNRGKLPLQVTL